VGLGNPGGAYQQTRHNLGWRVLEYTARCWGISFAQQGQVLIGEGAIDGHAVLLALPLVWMNQTGEVVRSLLHERNCAPSDLVLVYDDLDLPLGALKIKTRGGAGGHNGLRSVLTCLETEDFCRVKGGIGRPPDHVDPAQYVLSSFSQDQRVQIEKMLPKAVEVLECVICYGAAMAMNRFHSAPPPQ